MVRCIYLRVLNTKKFFLIKAKKEGRDRVYHVVQIYNIAIVEIRVSLKC